MNDLELLELLEKAKTKQRGPKGETGVGIESIEQFDGQSFTLRLSDGSFKKIALQPGADGAVGPEGQSGPKGEPGPAGRNGRDGSQGSPGRDGADGVPGVSTETAVVNSNGHLLLGLSDGAVIDVGRVVGPAGATGERGPTGLVGNDGRDGEAVLSGPRAPTQDDGKEGDMWIDISSAEFSFFKKNGEGWNKLAELRQVPRDLRVPTSGTGGGGGGGGNGELQNTRTLPLINGGDTIKKTAKNKGLPVPGVLITQEDANQYFLGCLREQDVLVSDAVPRPPYQIGQLWFSTNPEELTLYVFDGAVWVPAAPPVSLDGIEASIANVDAELLKINANVAINKKEVDEAFLDFGLQQTLDNNPVADKGFVLKGSADGVGTYDAVVVSPEVGRIVIAAESDIPVKPTFELVEHGKTADDNRHAQIELDEARLDINMDEQTDEIHFRFKDDEELILRHRTIGASEFLGKVKAAPGTQGNELVTYEQIANLAGEIDEIKDEKEKGVWTAELPSTGSEGGREVLVNAEGFPEAQGGSNMMRLTESGGDEGFGQLRILIDPGAQDAENQKLQRWLKDAAAECKADPDAFKDKYSFFCPEAEEKGFAVKDQPIHSIVDPSLTTFNVIFYGKPNTAAKEEDIIGVEFFQEGAEGHRPASGKFFMEAYQDKSAQEKVCQDEYTECLTGDPAADSRCLRDLDACMDNAEDGFKPVSDFGEATAIIFHKTDGKTPPVTHSFDEVRIGDSISITDKSTGHFIVAEIDVIQQVGEHIRFTIDTVSHSGGIIDGNKCSVEFYDFSLTPGGPELDNYVKKAGDNMTGTLESTSPIWIRPGDHGAKGANNMLVVNQQDATGGSIARFQKNAKDLLKIEYDRTINVCENQITNVAGPKADTDAANKIYVDNKVKKGGSTVTGTIPANLVLWEYIEGGKDVVMELNSNKFTIERDGESLNIYVSAWANGRFYAAGTSSNYSHEIGHTYVTINEFDSSCVLGAKATKLWLQQRKNKNDKTVYYHIVDCSYCKSGLQDHVLVAGRRYALNLPSPFPVFSYSKEYFLNTTGATQSIEDSVDEVAPEAIDVGEIHE